MEKSTSKVVGANLLKLRKHKKLTQLELAKLLNFSDKTISKWESGESLPNIDVLTQLTKFYEISMNDLVDPNFEPEKNQTQKIDDVKIKKVIVSLLFITILWLVLAVIFVYAKIYAGANLWTVFIWGVPISCVIAIVFNRFWGNSKVALYLISVLIWTFLAAVYLQFMDYSLWVIFILGVPAEVLTILWYGLRKQTAKMKSNQK